MQKTAKEQNIGIKKKVKDLYKSLDPRGLLGLQRACLNLQTAKRVPNEKDAEDLPLLHNIVANAQQDSQTSKEEESESLHARTLVETLNSKLKPFKPLI